MDCSSGWNLTEAARPYCEELKELGLLCKETHDTVIRFAPPLIITKEEIDWAIEKIKKVFVNKNIVQISITYMLQCLRRKNYESKRRNNK